MLVGALRSALSAKLAEQKLTVVEGWTLGSHKTKELRLTLARFHESTRTTIAGRDRRKSRSRLASRNLEGVKLVAPGALQPYDLLRHDLLFLSKEAAVRLGQSLAKSPSSAAVASDRVQIAPAPPAAESKPVKAAAKTSKAAPSSKGEKGESAAKPKAARKSAAKPKAPKAKE